MLALLLVAAVHVGDTATVHHGRQHQTAVRPPRVEAEIAVDGRLDEPVWPRAAVLTGFSQFAPADGIPAEDSTEVLVWYSPTAIHFGVRAYESHGAPRATLADRDKIHADDHVQILLGTFDDGRQAMVFGVNPLGVQTDGMLVETGQVRGNGFNSAAQTREEPDLSPDFVFESKGRLTEYGYEVEVRIPFKSLRYQPTAVQHWQVNVVRRVQHSGYEDTWAPARRANASFLAQSGRLEGLRDLRRGLVLDLNPVVTQRSSGAEDASGAWAYDAGRPELGGNVRWGITNNLTLNGTIRPDFSQVEADAGQFVYDPRRALFLTEKRPFFLDGIEQFAVPSQLVYTRAIVAPVAAAKVTGKVSGTGVAFLSAVDQRDAAVPGAPHPVFNILRVQRDVGAQSRIGLAYTDRVVGGDYNRMANVDTRLVFARLYALQLQAAGSVTRRGAASTRAPLWSARFQRNGRTFGMRYLLEGVHPAFEAHAGFVSRPGVARANIDHRVTLFGPRGALVESFTTDVALDGTWQYGTFTRRGDAQDKKLHVNTNTSLRGGWQVGGSVLVETFGYDPALYESYRIALPRGDGSGAVDTLPYVGTPRLPNLDYVVTVTTPDFRRVSGSVFAVWGRDENFFEWASARILVMTIGADWRPTEQLRVNAAYQHQRFARWNDGSIVGIRRIPRLKVEYQLSRAVFVRAIGEYDAREQDALRDNSRTEAPILFYDAATGTHTPAAAQRRNVLRADWLFSYQPSPGTVFFAGYGSLLQEPDALRFDRLRRRSDGFFLKLSYLFRV